MNENIDLIEILRDCPKGTKFYSAVFGEVRFIGIIKHTPYPIRTDRDNYTKEGTQYIDQGECILFPSKKQRDWSKFVPTWKQKKPKMKVTLYPFDKVLVRDSIDSFWYACFVLGEFKQIHGCSWKHAIPYNKDTAHLLGTNDDCPIDYEIEFSKEYKE